MVSLQEYLQLPSMEKPRLSFHSLSVPDRLEDPQERHSTSQNHIFLCKQNEKREPGRQIISKSVSLAML